MKTARNRSSCAIRGRWEVTKLLDWINSAAPQYNADQNMHEETGSDNNGNLRIEYLAHAAWPPFSVDRAYGYDSPSRITSDAATSMSQTFVYDAFGTLASEYGGTSSTSGTHYLTTDHLGSTRLVTDAASAEVTCYDYEPFGQQLVSGLNGRPACFGSDPGADAQTMRFTGKERDAETAGSASQGLDYFGARYFSGAQGRFTSPDAPFADQHAENPQNWNLYTYAGNNPLRYIDPTGNAYCSYSSANTPEGGAATTEESCTKSGGTWAYQPADLNEEWDAPVFNFSITTTENTGQLSASGQAVVEELGARADASNQMIGLVAVGSTAVGAGAALAPVAGQAINELAFGPATGRLFWAGGAAASSAASSSGMGRTIAQSPLGSLFDRVAANLPRSVQRTGWDTLSRFWASGAGGTINIFARTPREASTLYRVELPTLFRNPNAFKPFQYR